MSIIHPPPLSTTAHDRVLLLLSLPILAVGLLSGVLATFAWRVALALLLLHALGRM